MMPEGASLHVTSTTHKFSKLIKRLKNRSPLLGFLSEHFASSSVSYRQPKSLTGLASKFLEPADHKFPSFVMDEVQQKLSECDVILSSMKSSIVKEKLLITQETLRRNSSSMEGAMIVKRVYHMNTA